MVSYRTWKILTSERLQIMTVERRQYDLIIIWSSLSRLHLRSLRYRTNMSFDDTIFSTLEKCSLETHTAYDCSVHPKHQQYGLQSITFIDPAAHLIIIYTFIMVVYYTKWQLFWSSSPTYFLASYTSPDIFRRSNPSSQDSLSYSFRSSSLFLLSSSF